MIRDPPQTGADKSKWAAIPGSIDSPLKLFGLPVLAVDGLMALTTLALPEAQRIHGPGLALIVLLPVALLAGAIMFFRPENLQTQVQELAWKYAPSDGGIAGTSLRVSGRGCFPG